MFLIVGVILSASLELNCLPHKSSTVMEDTVTFLDEENNLMMEVRERLSTGSLTLLLPLQPGTVEVTAGLVEAVSLSSPLSTIARLEVLPRMVLEPRETGGRGPVGPRWRRAGRHSSSLSQHQVL